jgi:hypothetical protein
MTADTTPEHTAEFQTESQDRGRTARAARAGVERMPAAVRREVSNAPGS